MSQDDFDKRFMNAEWVLGVEDEACAVGFRRQAGAVDISSVPFQHIVNLVDDMEPSDGNLELQQINVLAHLAALADEEMSVSGFPFVFDDNIVLGVVLDLRPRQVARSLERLEKLGLITILGDRNARRRRASDVTQSNGIDLRVLIARYDELRP
ncbi:MULTISPECIES: helix-turn-helix domain-containing protein [Agrobacterium]|uniref:Plasmid replication protein C N-terminal domain-containing protein n=1 Tax=Agrobacterium larrymoorei TaxID=160699 RepID=A0ABX8TC32_9HYPH|nr:helix-turn-helix domain-containing protein [Agrobacterium larrymoorei]NSZ10066.1 hypothetical protein [Agrobacterium tumefaciens]QYA10796.1 hypothetical protein J5285_25925 [Agrobacterium larrymoorei]